MRVVGEHGRRREHCVLAGDVDGASPCVMVADGDIDQVASTGFQDGQCWDEAVQNISVDASIVLMSSSPHWDTVLVMMSAHAYLPAVAFVLEPWPAALANVRSKAAEGIRPCRSENYHASLAAHSVAMPAPVDFPV